MASHSSPPSKVRRGEVDGLVRDDAGYAYVAIHPLYSSPKRTRRCVLASRIIVCLLAFLALLFAVIGQIVPFGQEGRPKRTRTTYSVWQVKEYNKKTGELDEAEDNEDGGAAKVFAILTAIFSLVAFILAAVYAGAWSRDERVRFDEEVANEQLQARYGVERGGSQDSDVSFPYENERIANDRVAYVPFEEAEQRRRRVDRNMGIATFSMLVAAAACALITLIVMATYYSKHIQTEDSPKYREGLALFIVTLILALIAFVLIAIPPASALYLCNAPPLRRADLMVLDSAERDADDDVSRPHSRAAVRAGATHVGSSSGRDSRLSEKKPKKHGGQPSGYGAYAQEHQPSAAQRHASSAPPPPPPPPPPPAAQAQAQPMTNPYYPPQEHNLNNGMAVAQGIPMALPGPPIESLPPNALQQQQQQQQQSEYTSGAYYEPPPQLFNVNGKGGKGKSL